MYCHYCLKERCSVNLKFQFDRNNYGTLVLVRAFVETVG